LRAALLGRECGRNARLAVQAHPPLRVDRYTPFAHGARILGKVLLAARGELSAGVDQLGCGTRSLQKLAQLLEQCGLPHTGIAITCAFHTVITMANTERTISSG